VHNEAQLAGYVESARRFRRRTAAGRQVFARLEVESTPFTTVDILIPGIFEHVEPRRPFGHSISVFPTQTVSQRRARICDVTHAIARELGFAPDQHQFVIHAGALYILEANPQRAGRCRSSRRRPGSISLPPQRGSRWAKSLRDMPGARASPTPAYTV